MGRNPLISNNKFDFDCQIIMRTWKEISSFLLLIKIILLIIIIIVWEIWKIKRLVILCLIISFCLLNLIKKKSNEYRVYENNKNKIKIRRDLISRQLLLLKFVFFIVALGLDCNQSLLWFLCIHKHNIFLLLLLFSSYSFLIGFRLKEEEQISNNNNNNKIILKSIN